jgi:two-component system LytT family response regulator
MQVLIIDDEALARRRILRLLQQHWPNVDPVAECRNGTEAIECIARHRPDFIFLDIQMKDMTGFDILEALDADQRPPVIFVTAFDEYAIRAFDCFAFDYLLKPFQDERFHTSVQRMLAHLAAGRTPDDTTLSQLLQHIRSGTDTPQRLFPLREGSRISFVAPEEIRYVSASGYYIEVHTAEKRHLLRYSLTQMQEDLEPFGFIRIHRSTIINPRYLAEISHGSSSELEVKLRDGATFRVSKSYREELLSQLQL